MSKEFLFNTEYQEKNTISDEERRLNTEDIFINQVIKQTKQTTFKDLEKRQKETISNEEHVNRILSECLK